MQFKARLSSIEDWKLDEAVYRIAMSANVDILRYNCLLSVYWGTVPSESHDQS